MAYESIRLTAESARCLLCHDAPCTKACLKGNNPGALIQSLRFENIIGAKRKSLAFESCIGCAGYCESACSRGKIDRPIDIKSMMLTVEDTDLAVPEKRVDLSVTFLGVKCENPFFLSSSVVGSNYEMVAKAFQMGWAGVAFKTIGLFTPNEVSPRFSALKKEENPFVGFKNIEQTSDHPLEENIQFLKQLKKDYPSKVIIASIMGRNEEEWTKLAMMMEEAGADMIECNFSCPQMAAEGLGSDVGTNPELVFKYTKAARMGTKLPILAKMTPNLTCMELPAKAAIEAGANGIAAINTIKSIMNVDLNHFSSSPNVKGKCAVGGYSGKAVKPIALRFISDMKKDKELEHVPISGIGGIETWRDAAEFIVLGCETVQVTTAVMQYGYRIINEMIEGLSDYLIEKGYYNVSQILGQAVNHVIDAGDLNRETIEYPRFNRSTCIGCGRCYISCFDGGHQALMIEPDTRIVRMDPRKCVGCQLCKLVCPSGSITAGSRVAKKWR